MKHKCGFTTCKALFARNLCIILTLNTKFITLYLMYIAIVTDKVVCSHVGLVPPEHSLRSHIIMLRNGIVATK